MSEDPREPDDSARMRSRFDEIVQGLEFDLPDLTEAPAEPPPPVPRERPDAEPVEFDDLPDDAPYRNVDHISLLPRSAGITAGWAGLLGSPALLVVATTFGYLLPRAVTIAAILTFVASAIYLFSRLPSPGRGRWDGPDDGAVL